MVDIMINMNRQLANGTFAPYTPPPFKPPTWAIAVNCLLFTSMCISIVAALTAAIALQWVEAYDLNLDTTDTRRKAIRRHFRYTGVQKWRMGEIIAFLPVLLYFSGWLLFAGLAVWMYQVHKAVAQPILASGIFIVAFYLLATMSEVFFIQSPFRTPVGQGIVLYWGYLVEILNYLDERLQKSPYLSPVLFFLWFIIPWPTKGKDWSQRGREDLSLKTTQPEITTFKWLARSVELVNTPRAVSRLLLIVGHAFHNAHTYRFSPEDDLDSISWDHIFDVICQPFCDRTHPDEFDLETSRMMATIARWYSRFPAGLGIVKEIVDDSNIFVPRIRLFGNHDELSKLRDEEIDIAVQIAQWSVSEQPDHYEQIWDTLLTREDSPCSHSLIEYAVNRLATYIQERRPKHALVSRYVSFICKALFIPEGSLMSTETFSDMCIEGIRKLMHFMAFQRKGTWAVGHTFSVVLPSEIRSMFLQLHMAVLLQSTAILGQQKDPAQANYALQRVFRLLAFRPDSDRDEQNPLDRIGNEIIQKYETKMPENNGERRWASGLEGDRAGTIDPLKSLIPILWLRRLGGDRVHEILEIFIHIRKEFPVLPPLWRVMVAEDKLRRALAKINPPTPRATRYEVPIATSDILEDRQLIEALLVFDRIIAEGCTQNQELVMARLVIDDLSTNYLRGYSRYFTEGRKKIISELVSPILLYIGSKAAGLPISSPPPYPENPIWNEIDDIKIPFEAPFLIDDRSSVSNSERYPRIIVAGHHPYGSRSRSRSPRRPPANIINIRVPSYDTILPTVVSIWCPLCTNTYYLPS
jgi:hypothetical protein